jgi:hypothetical protein
MPFSFWFLTCAQIGHARALTGYTKTQSAKQAAERMERGFPAKIGFARNFPVGQTPDLPLRRLSTLEPTKPKKT